ASVAVVVLISYLIGFILGKIIKVPTGYLGIAELIIALILSYGIVLYSDKDADVLVKGTIVFFISLVIIMILIVAF
ncbi:MAG: restriction endonuclease, partial [Methanobrevibacter sp.]|nr:restriction endonuclease [Methanobrevibacter sp.]